MAGAARRGRPAPARPGRRPGSRHVAGRGMAEAAELRRQVAQYMDAGGFLAWSAAKGRYVILGAGRDAPGLAPCPECGAGQITVVRSRSTGKRFLGCTNYYGGCRASAPLLQRARVRALRRACAECGWPEVMFRYSSRQKWSRQCPNPRCPSRAPRP